MGLVGTSMFLNIVVSNVHFKAKYYSEVPYCIKKVFLSSFIRSLCRLQGFCFSPNVSMSLTITEFIWNSKFAQIKLKILFFSLFSGVADTDFGYKSHDAVNSNRRDST